MANEIRVRIIGDTSNFNSKLDQAGGTLGKFGRAAKVAGAALVVGLAVQAKKSIDAASNLNESVNAVNVTFGKASPKILKFSQNAAKMGLSTRAANEAAVPLGATLINAGFGAQEAAGKTQDLLERASDMASVFNTSVPDALQALQAGLRGESDPLERFGVGLSDAAVRAEALRMGLIKTTNEAMTPHEKAQARLALIMKQTNKVQGDFANTSGGLANQQRILSAQWENLSAKIGTALLPAVTAAISALNDLVVWVQVHWPEIKRVTLEVLDAVRAKWDEILAYYRSEVAPALQNVIAAITGFWKKYGEDIMRIVGIANTLVINNIRMMLGIITGIAKVFLAILRGDWSAAWNALKQIVSSVLNGILGLLKGFISLGLALARSIGGAIKDGLSAGLRGLGGVVTNALGAVKDAIFGVIGAAYGWGASLAGAIRDGFMGVIHEIVGAAQDALNAVLPGNPVGRAVATPGSSLDLAPVDGSKGAFGRAVVGAAPVINFNGPVYGNPQSIAQAVREEFVKMQRSGTRLGFSG